MTHTISIRTISIFAAIIGLLAIVLMTAQGNPAQGQSLPSVGFERHLTYTGRRARPEPLPGERQPHRPELSQTSSQNVTVRYQNRRSSQLGRQHETTSRPAAHCTSALASPSAPSRVTVLNDTRRRAYRERFYARAISQPILNARLLGSYDNVPSHHR